LKVLLTDLLIGSVNCY